MKTGVGEEPRVDLAIDGHQVTLLGTAHVSRASAEQVRALLAGGDYDAVAVELCHARHRALTRPDSLADLNLFQVLREGKAAMVMANLALGAFQQRLAEQFGIEPGADMRAAIDGARDHGLPLMLIDRDIGITLKRVAHRLGFWRRINLFVGLVAGLWSREKVSEADIERLKQGDLLETSFSEFAEQAADLYEPLIGERDRYMAARLRAGLARHRPRRTLAVVGAGHLQGIAGLLQSDRPPGPADTRTLETVPPAGRWLRTLPWLIVALILGGFFLGFRHSPDLGWRLVGDWVLINGGLAALGALLAAAHPLTILGAFAAAPLTSLNPMIGAGMVTAAVELFLRKPRVADFGRLRSDTARIGGWWRNRVARVLLVFLFTTLGSAIGTYVGGFRIFDSVLSG